MPARTAKGASARGSKRATTSGSSATPSVPPPEGTPRATYNPLQQVISETFASAQRTTAGHRKLAIKLRNLFDQCIKGEGPVGTIAGGGRAGEKAFGKEFIRNLNKVLLVKKGVVVGDRCVRFCELFVRWMIEKGM